MAIKGISLPFRKGSTSFPALVEDDTLVEDSLEAIIMTPVGQRVMRPKFGCNARLYVFENNNDILRAKVRQEVIRAIQVNEPRVKLTSVQVQSSENKVTVSVSYLVNRNPGTTTVEIPRAGV